MARPAAFAIALVIGVLFAGCSGPFGQSGVPNASDDLQTVSDAADSLVGHPGSGSENAKAAIVVVNAFGSVVRDLSNDERTLLRGHHPMLRRELTVRDRGIISFSQLTMGPKFGNVSAYCQSSAGYSLTGIPSLGETFGWQSGAFAGGTRMADRNGFATWSVNASGDALQAPIGTLSIVRTGGDECPMMQPAFSLRGASSHDYFSIPLTLTYRRGELWVISVGYASFSGGETINVGTSLSRKPTVDGVINRGTELATFHTDSLGNGRLTVTSTGAQYLISDWIVAGI
jgi:hypothetical protein